MILYLQNDLWRFDFGLEESLERASSSIPLWPLWSFSLRGQKAEHLLYLVIPCYLWLVDHSWWFKVALLFLKKGVLESQVRNIGILLRSSRLCGSGMGFLLRLRFPFPVDLLRHPSGFFRSESRYQLSLPGSGPHDTLRLVWICFHASLLHTWRLVKYIHYLSCICTTLLYHVPESKQLKLFQVAGIWLSSWIYSTFSTFTWVSARAKSSSASLWSMLPAQR